MIMKPIDERSLPCPMLVGGKLCGRTDPRPLVCHRHLGWICREHSPFTPKQREAADVDVAQRQGSAVSEPPAKA